jgi:UDP-N-acetylglucosamine acyltransferase
VIHPTAIVDPGATLGAGVEIGPYCVVGPKVVLGDNVELKSHVVIKGPSRIGARVCIYQFATVGEDTPAFAYAGEDSILEIGEDTTIREGVTIHRGMAKGGISKTVVGANCLLMAYVHIGHDCIVGNNVVMANNASIAGHVEVGDYANFGGYSGIPQFRKIGAFSHIAAMSLVTKDVPAFMTVAGNPASAVGLNVEGIKRRNIEAANRAALKQAHRLVYRSGLKVGAALGELAELRTEFSEVEVFAASIEASDLGIIRGSERGRAK